MALKTLFGLWGPGPDYKGNTIMSGTLGKEIIVPAGTKLKVFRNSNKRDDRSPDFNVCAVYDDEKDAAQHHQSKYERQAGDDTLDDEVPF